MLDCRLMGRLFTSEQCRNFRWPKRYTRSTIRLDRTESATRGNNSIATDTCRALRVLIPELDKYRLSIIIVRPGEVSPMIPLRCAEIITMSCQQAVRLLETLLPHVTLF